MFNFPCLYLCLCWCEFVCMQVCLCACRWRLFLLSFSYSPVKLSLPCLSLLIWPGLSSVHWIISQSEISPARGHFCWIFSRTDFPWLCCTCCREGLLCGPIYEIGFSANNRLRLNQLDSLHILLILTHQPLTLIPSIQFPFPFKCRIMFNCRNWYDAVVAVWLRFKGPCTCEPSIT